MGKAFKNNPDATRKHAAAIAALTNKSIAVAHGTSEVSNDGLTAKYSDRIIDFLDDDLKKSFHTLFNNSKLKLDAIAESFETMDQNMKI